MNKKCDHILGAVLYDDESWLYLESRGIEDIVLCTDLFKYCPNCGANLTEIDISKLPEGFNQPIKIFNTALQASEWVKGNTAIGKNAKTAMEIKPLQYEDVKRIVLKSNVLDYILEIVTEMNNQNIPKEKRCLKLPLSLIEII